MVYGLALYEIKDWSDFSACNIKLCRLQIVYIYKEQKSRLTHMVSIKRKLKNTALGKCKEEK